MNIIAPLDGAVVEAATLDVTVEFTSSSTGRATGTVSRLELLADGSLVASKDLRPPQKQGTHTFTSAPIAAARADDGVVKLEALAYHGSVHAGIAGRSAPIFVGSDPAMVGVQQLRAASLRPPTFVFDRGVPTFVDMQVPIPSLLRSFPPTYAALDFLDRFKSLYGLRDPGTQLYLHREATGRPGVNLAVFNQKIDGLPVFGGKILVAVSSDAILWTSGSYVLQEPSPRTPRLSSSQAEEIARAHEGDGAFTVGEPALEWLDPALLNDVESDPTLVWRVPVGTPEDGRAFVFVDALNAGVVRRLAASMEHDADKDFQLEWAHNRSGANTCFDVTPTTELGNQEGVVTKVYDALPADLQLDASELFHNTHEVYDYFYDNWHRHSYDGSEAQVEEYMEWGNDAPNAGYSGPCGTMFFTRNYTDRDVIGHEYSHGVTYWTSELVYENEAGALNESFSDIMSAMIDGDWIHGDEKRVAMNSCVAALPAGAVRSLSNPTDCGQPDKFFHPLRILPTFDPNDDNDHGGVHRNSGISNKAAFLITDGGTHSGITVARGIGREKARHLFYWLFTGLRDLTGFDGLRRSATSLARAWVDGQVVVAGAGLFTESDLCAVVNGFAAVDLGDPDRDCDRRGDLTDQDDDGDGVIDTADNCQRIFNPPQTNTDGDRQGDVCDDDDDNDLVLDATDNCPLVSNNSQADVDGDRRGDVCDDDDRDRVIDINDNCSGVFNPAQENTDRDVLGDACDPDDDNDTIPDAEDNCRLRANRNQEDLDFDGVGDVCDNCPSASNPGQENQDGDGRGDLCDADIDGDGIANEADSCPHAVNSGWDLNNDGRDMACDEDEAFMFSGEARRFRFTLQVVDPSTPFRIPIEPCGERFCQPVISYISDRFRTDIDMTLDVPAQVHVVDDLGNVFAADRRGLTKEMAFAPRGDYYYVDTAGETFGARSFYLEILPPRESEIGDTISVDFTMNTDPGVEIKPIPDR